MTFSITLTKRTRKRKLQSGSVVEQLRHVLNYREPNSGMRRQEFFEKAKEAEARKTELIVKVASSTYVDEKAVPTIGEALDHWLADRQGQVKANTLGGYKVVVAHIRGPHFVGTSEQKADYQSTGKLPKGAKLVPMLGGIKLSQLTMAKIRTWHREVQEFAGAYTANRAKAHLKSILALAEEDFNVRPPSMPNGLGRIRGKVKKAILTPDQIALVIKTAMSDPDHGIYYAFPFLAGTRPSEQLGLIWNDIDFDKGVIRISRIQERDGTFTEMTKTEAGTREIPMGKALKDMLLSWRERCPRKGVGKDGVLHRVFPGPGRLQEWPRPRLGGGGALLYQNFRRRYWEPIFKRLGLPYVTPHSARHSFISNLQAQGIEVGLVAKLAGHASAAVTLSHYTQAVRGGEAAAEALERAYAA